MGLIPQSRQITVHILFLSGGIELKDIADEVLFSKQPQAFTSIIQRAAETNIKANIDAKVGGRGFRAKEPIVQMCHPPLACTDSRASHPPSAFHLVDNHQEH